MSKRYILSDLGEFRNGLNFTKHTVNQPCKMIGIPDFGDRVTPDYATLGVVDKTLVSDDYLLKDGDILFVRSNGNKNLVGRTMIIEKCQEDVSYSGFCIRLRPNTEIVNSMYLLYLLKSPAFRKKFSQTQQSNINNINQDTLGSCVINLPDRIVQKSIARQIEILDRKISLNNAINAELEKAAKLLYDYWFVQFDFPNTEGKPYRASGGEMVYSEQLKREIPKGWRVETLKSLTNIVLGGTPSTGNEEYWGNEYRWLNSGEVANFPVVSSELGVTQKGIDNSATKLMPAGTTVVSITGNIRASILGIESCANQSVVGIYEIDMVKHSYLYPLICRLLNKYTVISTGNCQTHINKGTIEDTAVVVPPEAILDAYNAICAPIYKKIQLTALQIKELTALRDFLLPLLMNGQVTVSSTATAIPTVNEVDSTTISDARAQKTAVFKRLVLSAYILDNICDEPTAGRVKFEKLLFLSEYCAEIDLHSDFQRYAAGPYDPKALYSIEVQLKKNNWFARNTDKTQSKAYVRLGQTDGYKPYVKISLQAKQKSVIDGLIHLFKNARTIKCEIIATLYGAWNDFLIEGVHPTDSQIVDEVLTNWHERKERIDRQRWLTELGWMRQNSIIPLGYGTSTKGR